MIKQFFVTAPSAESIVIDSNQLAEERIRKALKEQGEERIPDEDGFIAGLDAPEVEMEDPEQVLADAKAEAEAILGNARIEVDHLLAEANNKAEGMYEARSREGYEAGMQQAQEENERLRSQCEQEYQSKIRECEERYESELQRLEPDLVDALIRVFDKVFNIHFEDRRPIILSLVDQTMHSVESAKSFHVRVSEQNCAFLEEHLEELRSKVASDVELLVSGDPTLSEDFCRIETEHGVFDCSIDTEMDNLIRDIRSLCGGAS